MESDNKRIPISHQDTNEEMEIDLVALLYRLLEKSYWIILSAFICAGIAAVFVFKFATPMYKATSKIYIVGSDTAISLSDLQVSSSLAADYQEVFKNWHIHELVNERLKLNYSYSQLERIVSVSNPSNTHVLYITAQSTDPQEAKRLADAYAQVSREFIAIKMDMREPNVFEEAKTPTRPFSPQKTKTILIGFLIGTVIAAGIIAFLFIFDDKILVSDDIEKAGGLATLGMIPLQGKPRKTKKAGGNSYEQGDNQ